MNISLAIKSLPALAIGLFYVTTVSPEELKVISWNVKEGSVEAIAKRRSSIEKVPEGRAPDILILQEVNSFASVQRIAESMKIENPHIAVSDFGSDSEIIYFGFETAVVSKFPIKSVTEWQHKRKVKDELKLDQNGPITITPDGTITLREGTDIEPLEVPEDVITDAQDSSVKISRGILRVELENGLVIYPVHLKSNLPRLCAEIGRDASDAINGLNFIGQSVPERSVIADEAIQAIRLLVRTKAHGVANPESLSKKSVQEGLTAFTEMHALTAAARENGAAAIAKLVVNDLRSPNIVGVIVAGDFNTPLNEPSKSGNDLDVDCMPSPLSCSTKVVPDSCMGEDGFDDTHHILQDGVVDGLEMEALFTKELATHTGDGFAQSPIDNIYVAGTIAETAGEAKLVVGSGARAFGSDHFPLEVILTLP